MIYIFGTSLPNSMKLLIPSSDHCVDQKRSIGGFLTVASSFFRVIVVSFLGIFVSEGPRFSRKSKLFPSARYDYMNIVASYYSVFIKSKQAFILLIWDYLSQY